MKIATQNQAFFPSNILEKFEYIKAMGFDGYEIDGKLLVENLAEVKAAIKATGLPVTIAKQGGNPVDARSILGVMALGAKNGEVVTLSAEGDGADAALDSLVALLERDLDAE